MRSLPFCFRIRHDFACGEPQSMRTLLLALMLTGLSLPLRAYDNLPDMGDSASQSISAVQEQAYGRYIMRELRKSGTLNTDPQLNDYLNQLGQKLVSHSNNDGQRQFTFFLVNNRQINAFALPGGYIGIHTGLILAADSESELAAVMAHEIAHVTQHHISRRFEQASRLSIPSIAATIASLLLATQNPEAGLAALQTTQAAAQQFMLNFSRDHEREADRFGMQTLVSSQFNPDSMATFFDKLAHAYRFERLPPPYLMSHPVTDSRIADARNRIAQLPPAPYRENSQFALMHARLGVLSAGQSSNLTGRYLNLLKAYPQDLNLKYALAQAYLKQNQPAQAVPLIRELRQKQPDTLSFILLDAEALQASKQLNAAQQLLEQQYGLRPDNYSLAMDLSELYLFSTPKRAIEILTSLSQSRPEDAAVWLLLSQAQAKAGLKGDHHESQAEYRFLLGDLKRTEEQLRLANTAFSDQFYDRQRIQEKLRQIHQIQLDRQD